MRRAACLLVAMAGLGGCVRLEPGAHAGRAEAADSAAVALPVERRVLVLDGYAGAVVVREHPAAVLADVRWVRRARGATAASAAARLEAVSVRTGGDADLAQVVWRVDARPEAEAGTAVDVRVVVPPGTPVVVRLAAGTLDARGLTGGLDAEVGGRAVRPSAGSLPLAAP